jgi:hypothetical protein
LRRLLPLRDPDPFRPPGSGIPSPPAIPGLGFNGLGFRFGLRYVLHKGGK